MKHQYSESRDNNCGLTEAVPRMSGLRPLSALAAAGVLALSLAACHDQGSDNSGPAPANVATAASSPTLTPDINVLPGLEEQVWVDTGIGNEQCLQDAVVKSTTITKSVSTGLCRVRDPSVTLPSLRFFLYQVGQNALDEQEEVDLDGSGDGNVYFNYPSNTPGVNPVRYRSGPDGEVSILMVINGQNTWVDDVAAYQKSVPLLSVAELDGEAKAANYVLAESLSTTGPIPWSAEHIAAFTTEIKQEMQLNSEMATTKEQIIAQTTQHNAPQTNPNFPENGNALGIQALARSMDEANRVVINTIASDCGAETESVAGGCFDESHQEQFQANVQ